MCKIPPGRIGRASESPLPIPLGDEDKIGKISVEDYADAMIDERNIRRMSASALRQGIESKQPTLFSATGLHVHPGRNGPSSGPNRRLPKEKSLSECSRILARSFSA